MKKVKNVTLDDVLKKELKDETFRLFFEEKKFYLQIAKLVSDLRSVVGISQVELAKRAKVSQPLIARLERGDSSRTPTIETIYKILKALGYRMNINVSPVKKSA